MGLRVRLRTGLGLACLAGCMIGCNSAEPPATDQEPGSQET